MSLSRVVKCSTAVVILVGLAGCGKDKSQALEKYGKFTLYGIKYDNVDQGRAKDNAADMLTQMANEKNVVMVGLWAYNPPAILEAVKAAKKEGEVKIVGFDEDDNTLRGVADGHIYATVVQQPFEFGYQSVKLMAELARDAKAPLPKEAVDGVLHVPHRVIKKDNVEEFRKKLKADIASAKESAPAGGGDRIKVLFVSNNEAEFWTIAEAGTRKAAKDLAEKGINVEVIFKRPKTGQAGEQTQIIEDNLGVVNAVAVSVNDADNQLEFLNKVADKVPLLCVDNDAPKSRRRCYIGTDNVAAGREVGRLVKEALPDGGALAIFVGKPDAPNAIQRRQGVLDELAGK
jgi:ribose transport system substrate-binding protein